MGWVWKDDPNDAVKSATLDGDHCSTRKVIQSKCKNEEVEPGKFIRKCEKTEEVLRECVGSFIDWLFLRLDCFFWFWFLLNFMGVLLKILRILFTLLMGWFFQST
ncbi:hypothetical protein V6Z11_D11G243200 [Gossypium hirsutum]|uniref:Fra a 1-associated protein-like isoform X1 n=1 Tax=Gossypium hirsutum TaxID=3635 RepID=A0A1U8K2G1_GOSHI|nr:fra a 1-associated protein-like isoform X1 [Gossypium hirsutum]